MQLRRDGLGYHVDASERALVVGNKLSPITERSDHFKSALLARLFLMAAPAWQLEG